MGLVQDKAANLDETGTETDSYVINLAYLTKSIWMHLVQRFWPSVPGCPPQDHGRRWTICQSDVDTIKAIDNKTLLVRPPSQSMFGHKARNHPRALEIERTCDQWLIDNFSWLFKDQKDMDKLLRNRLTRFMTHIAPDADMDLMILSTDICNYGFLLDDFLFDSLHIDLKRTESIMTEYMQILSNPTSPIQPTTYWTAIVKQNLLPRMYQHWPRKYIRDFYVEMNKLLWISLQNAQTVRRGWMNTDWDQYLMEQYYNHGVNFTMSIFQPCFGVDILAGAGINEKCRNLLYLNGQFLSFSNDLHSFKKDVLIEKNIRNVVWVYKMLNHVSWQQAIDDIKRMTDGVLIDATKLIDEMRKESGDPEVHKWLDQVVPIFQWVHNGYCQWAVNQTERYTRWDKMDECALTNFRPELYKFSQYARPTEKFCTAEEEGKFLAEVKHANVC